MNRAPDTGDRTIGHFLREELDRDPASLAFVGLAHLCIRDGRTDEAIRLCRAGLAHHPNHSTGHLLLAIALEKGDAEEEAIQEFQEVVQLDPGNRIAARRLAEAEHRRSLEEKEKRREENRADGEPPAEGTAESVEEIAFFTFSMAEVFEQQGFFEKALLIYDRVLRLQPDRPDVQERIERLKRKLSAA
ncbi:MAG: tetratricopeptide repeat protein [Candidatus Eisenbacteria bacterium]|nr:tetratricopeptide repeat protein [Candidatus Eisenbacteria bacterium]